MSAAKKSTKDETEKVGEQPAIAKPQAAVSERFLADVERQFQAELGAGPRFTALERRLVQHMYLAVDQALKTAEADRVKKNKPGAEFTWHNIDRQKLALDTVHRVSLGLDALVPGHLWPVTYFNSAKGLYDVDLRIGYIGRDYVTRRFALEEPVDITYELVYSTDEFKALPRSATRDVEGYEFEITSPFERGEIVGGFGYVTYEDPRKNRLILVTKRDFKRAKDASKSHFWNDNDVEMHLKTIYHRVAGKIPLDPAKVNAEVLASVLEDDHDVVTTAAAETSAAARANGNGQVLTLGSKQSAETIDVEVPTPAAEPEPVPAQAPKQADAQLFDAEEAPY